jgi:hypothetical protein
VQDYNDNMAGVDKSDERLWNGGKSFHLFYLTLNSHKVFQKILIAANKPPMTLKDFIIDVAKYIHQTEHYSIDESDGEPDSNIL